MTFQRSFPSCSRAYCRMCICKGRPLRGKVPNRKNLRCQCSSQRPVLRQNGEIYYNPDANSGLHLGRVTSRTSLKCLPPLDSPERIFGGISSSQSSARTPMRRAATLEKTWKMSNRNGRIRSIISSNTRRMSLALLALIWREPFLALTLTTLQHFRQLKTQKLYMHVDGRPRKVRTVSRGEPCLMYETRLSRMIMQLPPAQMANRDGDAGMETMLWDINIIPNELDNGYLMLPPGVLHMSALGRFGRFTLFSPRVSHSKHLPVFVLCCVLGLGVFLSCFCFLFLQVFWNPEFSAQFRPR